VRRPLEWQIAIVKAIAQETAQVKTITLALPGWTAHRAGQHYDVRLTAADGYQAQRSYSIASPPERSGEVDLTVERIPDGEVSPYLHDVLVVGDAVEVRGPVGGYFVWEASSGGPLLLVAGGSGVVPLMAMLRHRAAAGAKVVVNDLGASLDGQLDNEQPANEVVAAIKAMGGDAIVFHTLTRGQPKGWTGYARRIDQPMLAEVSGPLGTAALAFICGPTALVETTASALVQLGLPQERVRTERFGPTGT